MNSSTAPKTLIVQKPYKYLCFEHCSEDEFPQSKMEQKKLVQALKSFFNEQSHSARAPHKLKNKGTSRRIQDFITRHGDNVYSIDVGHRGGACGDMRLIYLKTESNVVKVLSLFCDDH